MNKFNWKILAPILLLAVIVCALFYVSQNQQTRTNTREISYSELLIQIDGGQIHDVVIEGNEIIGHFKDNRSFQTYAPTDVSLIQKLQAANIQITARPDSTGRGGFWTSLLVNALPLLIFIGVWVYMSRQMNGMGGRGGPMGFGKSKARLMTETEGKNLRRCCGG